MILVIFLFLRKLWATVIPGVTLPVSLIATFGGDGAARLQPGQPVADGADRRVRLRGRRRHRHDRKHRALHRGRRPSVAGRAQRRATDRLHGDLADGVADRRVHPAAADGRRCRPAVPRIRDDALGGGHHLLRGLADPDADDVRATARARTAGTSTGRAVPLERARLRRPVPALCLRARLCAATARRHAGVHAGNGDRDRLALYRRSQGFPAASGHRAVDRRHRRCAGYFIPRHGGATARRRRHCRARSRGARRRQFRRRRHGQSDAEQRPALHRHRITRDARRQAPRDHAAAQPRGAERRGHLAAFAAGAGLANRDARQPHAISICAAGSRRGGTARLERAAAPGVAPAAGIRRRRQRPAGRRHTAWRSRSTARPRPATA